jgi:hypothetical protein
MILETNELHWVQWLEKHGDAHDRVPDRVEVTFCSAKQQLWRREGAVHGGVRRGSAVLFFLPSLMVARWFEVFDHLARDFVKMLVIEVFASP